MLNYSNLGLKNLFLEIIFLKMIVLALLMNQTIFDTEFAQFEVKNLRLVINKMLFLFDLGPLVMSRDALGLGQPLW